VFSTEPVDFSKVDDYKCGYYIAKENEAKWDNDAIKKLNKFKRKCRGENEEIGISDFFAFFNDYFPDLVEDGAIAEYSTSDDICQVLFTSEK